MAKKVLQNTVQNMGEDLIMIVGYSKVNSYLHDKLKSHFPTEHDEQGREVQNIALEVLSGGVTYLFMSVMMEAIRREEKVIQHLFVAGEAIIAVLYARNKGYITKMMNRIKGLKGVKAVGKFKSMASQTDNTNSFIGQVYQAMQNIQQGRAASHNVAETIQASNASIDTAINREAHNLKFAELQNKSFSSSLFIKTATGTFTAADKQYLQKMIGRENFSSVPLDVDELNKIKDFMYVKSSDGEYHGLSDLMSSLINGLGYFKQP